MTEYKGIIESHHAINSKDKGTPGIEFNIELHQVKRGGEWFGIEKRMARANVWFSAGGDHSYSISKLTLAGFKGGSLGDMNLTGNTALVDGQFETYNGNESERFDLALPRRGSPKATDAAFLAIDAVLQAATIQKVELPEPIDETKPVVSAEVAKLVAEAPALPVDLDVPF